MVVKFVLEILDVDTRCANEVHYINALSISEIAELLNIDEFPAHFSYELDNREIERLAVHFKFIVSSDGACGRIHHHTWVNDLPYAVHTNNELSLMLEGTKPLAVFCEADSSKSSVEMTPEKLFDPYVAVGRFIKREYCETISNIRVRRILYALPWEVWRVDAYILMQTASKKVGWNDGFELMEGYLLGYEEWQCDAYLKAKKIRRR